VQESEQQWEEGSVARFVYWYVKDNIAGPENLVENEAGSKRATFERVID
jgi:hypothetical protein